MYNDYGTNHEASEPRVTAVLFIFRCGRKKQDRCHIFVICLIEPTNRTVSAAIFDGRLKQ
ncbi:MAG TPA: hypothetical protein DCZ10_05015 [Pelotomaculum sp.]|nr:hypothetical protein [Pelotomaculum sp.]